MTYGTDIGAIDDLDANLTPVDDRTAFMQALVRRITAPRGALWYAPDYGYDVSAAVNSATDVAVIEANAEAELLRDERVDDADVTLTVTEPTGDTLTGGKTWSLDLRVTASDEPYAFTLSVDAVTGALLLEAVD